ncbi:MAG: type II toxin-antitoxin system RelE/ParE family toxin [Nanoarchaeota archaeon]|nr:type II toxin-antitoxin system RelE/ParE family toxin [Nanoarchaeota archaeon]
MYALAIKPELDKLLQKLQVKNRKHVEIIDKKLREIRLKPEHEYKPLRSPLQGFCRVHIDKSFVLIFRIVHAEQVVEAWYFGHHDEVYQWQPKLNP